MVVLGDINLLNINRDTLCSDSQVVDAFCNMTFELNLSQLVDCPTHNHGNILDLILTNNEDLIQNITVHSDDVYCISSDHFLINFELPLGRHLTCETTASSAFDYSIADFVSMDAFIFNSGIHNWDLCDVKVVWTAIKSVIFDAMIQFIPSFQFRSNQYPKWFMWCRDLKDTILR